MASTWRQSTTPIYSSLEPSSACSRTFVFCWKASLRQPDCKVAQLPLLTENERQQLLVEWNKTESAYPDQTCLHELFEEQVEETPEAIAVVFEDAFLTYRELDSRANQVAHYLRNRYGVGPETLVGLAVHRSLAMLIGMLGILKAGAAYVPLDPDYPRERLAFVLEDAQAPVLVTPAALQEQMPVHSAVTVCLDSDWGPIAQEPTHAPRSRVAAENLVTAAERLAYTIYTSGSTGKPKGVQITHRALVNFLYSMRTQPGLTEQDTLLAVTSISFDIAGLELFLPLLFGARLVIVQPGCDTRWRATAAVDWQQWRQRHAGDTDDVAAAAGGWLAQYHAFAYVVRRRGVTCRAGAPIDRA